MNSPNVYHLWALRSINKTWIRKKKMKIEGQVSAAKFHTISFVRLGKLKDSKSKIVNAYLTKNQGKQEKTIFLMKDDDHNSKLSSGTIEMFWFAPQEEENSGDKEHLQNLTCIYNLR